MIGKDSYTLNRNSWYMKVMKYMWNLGAEDFSHVCPLFWLSVLNVFIIVPFFIVKELIRLVARPFIALDNWYEEMSSLWVEENFFNIERMNEEAMRAFAKRVACGRGLRGKYKELYGRISEEAWAGDGEPKAWWIKFLNLVQQYEDEIRQEQESRSVSVAQAKLQRKRKINTLLKWVKPVSTILLWMFSSAAFFTVGWLLYKFYVLLSRIPVKGWVLTGKVVFSVALIVVFAYLLAVVIERVRNSQPSCEAQERNRKIFRTLGAPFRAIGTFFSFLVQMVKDNCPAVVWKEN